MVIYIPTPLRSYTVGLRQVETRGATLRQVFDDLEARYPGLRFRVIDEQDRIREHIRLFVDQTVAPDLDAPVKPDAKIQIILAISGG